MNKSSGREAAQAQSVSRQVSALESELGTPLHPHARGLILTEEGDLLMRAARDIGKKQKGQSVNLGIMTSQPIVSL